MAQAIRGLHVGWCAATSVGAARNPDRHQAILKNRITLYPGYRYRPWVELAELLSALTPGKLTRCSRAQAAVRPWISQYKPPGAHGTTEVSVAEDAYHGNTIAGLSVGGADSTTSDPITRI